LDKPDSETFKLPERKHRQHHVWQHYLAPWASDGKIFSLIDGKPCRPNTKNVAVERHFYRLHRLTAADIGLLKLFIDAGPSHAKRLHEDFVTALLMPRAFVERHQDQLKNKEEMEEILLTQEINVLEDYHASIEDSFAETLLAIRNGDLSFYDDTSECIMFARYMATQYMRTKGIKVRTTEIFQRKMGVDISRIWDIASLMQGVNIGCSLFLGRQRQQLALLRNKTDLEFITGDQPVINLHGGDQSKASEQLCMYYPVDPRAALIWGEKIQLASETLNAEQFSGLNQRMFAASHSQAFGRTAVSLERFATRSRPFRND
jgi:Protein of unknown function (DUF4238)